MTSDIITDEKAFAELEAEGYTSEYIKIETIGEKRVMSPAFDLECCRGCAAPKGSKVRFLGKNGYDYELRRALESLTESQVLTVKSASIGSWSSEYRFEEIDGTWNTAMFERI